MKSIFRCSNLIPRYQALSVSSDWILMPWVKSKIRIERTWFQFDCTCSFRLNNCFSTSVEIVSSVTNAGSLSNFSQRSRFLCANHRGLRLPSQINSRPKVFEGWVTLSTQCKVQTDYCTSRVANCALLWDGWKQFPVLSTTCSLMGHYNLPLSVDAKIMVATNCPIFGERVAVNCVAQ